MTATKIVIIVLVVIVVLFVVLVVWGAGNNSSSSGTNADNFTPDSAPVAGGINDLFGSHGSKFDPAYLRPQLTSFDLQKQTGYSVEVLADDKHPLRQMKIKIQPA